MTKGNKFFLLAVGALMAISYGAVKYWPRGIRNNNPGNIRHSESNQWLGMTGQDGGGFVIFTSPAYGIRAMGRILDSYQRRGVYGLSDIIATWAPSGDSNDVAAYIDHVVQLTGWHPNHVPVRNEGDFHALIKAMIVHENGRQPYTDEYIAESLALA